MIKHVRTNGTTQFLLYFSHVNCAWIYRRTDVGALTEQEIFEPQANVEEIASKYFNEKIKFYCEVCGITEDQLKRG